MPEQARIVVANTTPIIAMALLSHLDLLQQLYGEIFIPPAVRAEAMAGGRSTIGVAEIQRADWIRTVPLRDATRADLLSDLDRGEAEVIALAQELRAGLVIIDERLGRRHAKRLGLVLTGTLGVLVKAKQRGHLSSVKPLIEQLLEGGIRLDETIVGEALGLAGEG